MGFTCKVVLSGFTKEDGMQQLLLQALINRKRAVVPLGFCVDPKDFDKKNQQIKASHRNRETYNTEIQIAITKANQIASQFRIEKKPLLPADFRKEFADPTDSTSVIKFIAKELELRKPMIAHNTYKGHNTLIEKLKSLNKDLTFDMVNEELIQQLRNKLKKDGNGVSTIDKQIKNLKHYLSEARKRGIALRSFDIKIKNYKSNRLSLSQDEVNKLHSYYVSKESKPSHKKVLRYFLFSCYTGLRISDITSITWSNLHGDILTFTPKKTKKDLQTVTVPLSSIDKFYLPEKKASKDLIFETFADQVTNRYLKNIASDCGIQKKVTYHTSRHTFGSLFAEGGNIVALQKMMGHKSINTTMGYVHTSTKNLIDAKQQRFGK
jgi:integrase/recombinase XerD